jgi:hypothetical protein
MWNRRITKEPHDVQEGVRVSKGREIQEGLRPRLRAARASDVREFDCSGHVLAGVEQRRQPIEALIRDARDADVGLRLPARSWRFPGARQ